MRDLSMALAALAAIGCLVGPVEVGASEIASAVALVVGTTFLLGMLGSSGRWWWLRQVDAYGRMMLVMTSGVVLSLHVTAWTPAPDRDALLSALEPVSQERARLAVVAAGLWWPLNLAYTSILLVPHALLGHALVSRCMAGWERFIRGLSIATPAGLALYALLPARGPWATYVQSDIPMPSFFVVYEALRRGVVAPVELDSLVTTPSFHAVVGTLLATSYGGRGAFVVWGASLVVTAWPCGWHYLPDLVLGVLIAIGADRLGRSIGPTQALAD